MTEPADRDAVIDAGARAYADLNDGLSAHEDSAVDEASAGSTDCATRNW